MTTNVNETKTHIANLGRMIEDMESEMRSNLYELYILKTREVVNSLRTLNKGECILMNCVSLCIMVCIIWYDVLHVPYLLLYVLCRPCTDSGSYRQSQRCSDGLWQDAQNRLRVCGLILFKNIMHYGVHSII